MSWWEQVRISVGTSQLSGAESYSGPAHAVYFATYESVKQAMGGNEGLNHEHHPLAAGKMVLYLAVGRFC